MTTTQAEVPRTARALALDAEARRMLLASLQEPIPQRALPPGYRFGMTLLAFAMIVLSGAFVVLVGFLVWLGVWHLINAVTSLSAGPYFLFHVPMAILGLLLVVLLIKPVFFRQKEGDQEVLTLDPAKEPLLFEYVGQLCKAAGAPMPDKIEVDCVPNAHAGFVKGFGGLTRRKMVMRIGLPLAAAMPVNQFTGILAHEIGHLTQRGGMMAQYLVRNLTFFFAKIVFQRDRLDEMLERLRANPNGISRLIYWGAVLLIEPARGVLFVMLMLGESLSAHFLRRMEFDADCLEAQIYGAAEFEKVSQLLAYLHVGAQRTHGKMANSWEQKRLGDDFPQLIVGEAQYLARNHKDLIDYLEQQKTRWFDSHPCHSDRVLGVQDLEGLGEPRITATMPAAALFADFPALCKQATRIMYGAILKEELSKATFVSSSQMASEFSRQQKRFKALDDFFCGQAGVEGPIFPAKESGALPLNVQESIAALKAAREGMVAASTGITPAVGKLEQCTLRIAVGNSQRELAGLFPGNAQANGLMRKATKQLEKDVAEQTQIRGQTGPFNEAAEKRFTLALQLAAHPAIQQQMRHGTTVSKLLARYLPLAQEMRDIYPYVEGLMRSCLLLRILHAGHSDEHPHGPLVDRILNTSEALLEGVKRVRERLDKFAYPFEHAMAGIRAGQSLTEEKPPEKNEPGAVHGYCVTCIDRFHAMAYRVLAQLAPVGAAVEASMELKPLPTPVVDDKEIPKERDRSGLKFWLGYGGRAAAGVLLLGTLLWWSFSPPALPTVSWGEGGRGRYRPAAFSPSVKHMNRYDASAYSPPSGGDEANGVARHEPPRGAPQFMPEGPPTYRPPTPGGGGAGGRGR